MLRSADEQTVISHLGWIDHGSVWRAHPAIEQVDTLELSDAQYLRLYGGTADLFSAAHYYAGELRRVTIHSLNEPEVAIARLTLRHQVPSFDGDLQAWAQVPRTYVGYLFQGAAGGTGHYLIRVQEGAEHAEVQRLDWFNAESYDLGYQTVLDPVEIPNTDVVVIPIQRDSRPILYDVALHQVVGHLSLAGQHGNPLIQFRARAPEAWAIDYDTLVRLDVSDWAIKDQIRLQDERDGVRLWVGELSFSQDESLCAVARPYSGDVVGIATSSFRVSHHAVTGRQPLDVALLRDGRVLARDWKTGDLLSARLEPGR